MSVRIRTLALLLSAALVPGIAAEDSDTINSSSKDSQTITSSSKNDDLDFSTSGNDSKNSQSGPKEMVPVDSLVTDIHEFKNPFMIVDYLNIDDAIKAKAVAAEKGPQTRTLTKGEVSKALEQTRAEEIAMEKMGAALVMGLSISGALNPQTAGVLAKAFQQEAMKSSAKEPPSAPGGPKVGLKIFEGKPEARPASSFLPPEVTRKMADRYPNDRWSQSADAYKNAMSGDAKGAYPRAKRAMDLGDRTPETVVTHAWSANQIGKPEEALVSARMLPRNQAARAQEMFALSALRERVQLKEPKKIAEQKIPSKPFDPVARKSSPVSEREGESAKLTVAARSALRRKDYDGALEMVAEAREQDPDNVGAINVGAGALNQLKQYKKALSFTDAALEMAPGNGESLMHKSFAEAKIGDFKHAKESALGVLRSNPKSAMGYQLLARAQAGLGDREGMLRTLYRGSSLSPTLERQYKRALEVPEDEDASLLFSDGVITASAVDVPVRSRRISMGTLALSGVALFGLLGLYGLKRSQEPVSAGALPAEARETLLKDDTPSSRV